MPDGSGGAVPSRTAFEALLVRWTRFVPAIVWLLWALHTLFLERRLADRWAGAPIESLAGFLAEVAGSYAALFVYGWLVALIVPRNRFVATAITAAFAALYALLLLYHWHTRGQFEWGVLWRFRREMLELEVRHTISSFLGWRSYVFPIGAMAAVVVLELAGRLISRPPRPRRRGLALLACAAAAAFVALGPVPTSDELTASLRAVQGNWRLSRMLPGHAGTDRYPYARRSLVSGVGSAPAKPPNVFFVVVESFNANFVEAKTGDGREYTPFFNSLIPKGVYVENFYGNSMESPRGQLATLCSVLPAMRGTVFETYRGIRMRCLPEILDERGYRTVFDEAARLLKFEDTGTFMEAIGFQVRRAALEPERERPADAVWGWGLQDDVFFREFFRFLDEDRAADRSAGRERPAFAFLCTISSHFPDNKIPLEKRLLFPGAQGGKVGYGNSIYLADTYLRTFFDELAARPELADSLIVVVGDHSYPAGEHGLADSQFGAWEEVFRTPLLILWNGHLQPRRIRRERWSQVDIAPTVLDLLGVDTPNHFLGRSILRGWDPRRDRVHLVQPFDGVHLAAIAGDLKYVLHVASGRESIFDLRRDPHEDVNLIERYRGRPELDDLRREVGKMLLSQKIADENRLWPPEGRTGGSN